MRRLIQLYRTQLRRIFPKEYLIQRQLVSSKSTANRQL